MNSNIFDNDSATGASIPWSPEERKLLQQEPSAPREETLSRVLEELQQKRVNGIPEREQAEALEQANLALQAAGLLLDLDKPEDSWQLARPTIEVFIAHQEFEEAAVACQYTYLAEQFDALPAIGQAAWLAVTYPVSPGLTARILEHIVDETPDEADGAAVAAATAHYVVDMRAEENEREELVLFTGALLARVARRHSQIKEQQHFELWVERMELDQPEKFLVRLRNVIEVLVQEDWWFEREQLQGEIPE